MTFFRFLPALITLSLALPLGSALAQSTPDNEAALLQEMLRARYGLSGEENVQILAGQLPDSLPADLPLPEGAQIIGSVVNPGSVAGGPGYTEILLQVNQSPEEIYSLYQQQLLDEGWQLHEVPEVNEGFIAEEATETPQVSSSINSSRLFCSPSQAAYLHVTTAPSQTNSSTAVNLALRTPYVESQSSSPFECFPGIEEALLPGLTLPANAQLISGGSSVGNDGASSDVVIQTDLEAEALINHYATQLQQAGWTQVETSEVGLSRWSYQDEEGRNWQGLLLISEIQGTPDYYSAYVQMLRRPEAIAP